MKGKKNAGYRDKHPGDLVVSDDVLKAVAAASEEGRLECAKAFELAKKMGTDPLEIGRAADIKNISIVKCQLGLYGYGREGKALRPAESVASSLREKILSSIEGGKLPCKKAWAIALEQGLKKMDVSSACEAMGIKISSCQLGAF